MAAGSLDRWVQFRRAAMSDDGFSSVETFADYGNPQPAKKEDASDAERWRAHEVGAMISTRFTVRWSPFTAGLTPKDRMTFEGAEYNITGIKEVGPRHRWFEITASARADQ